jgi:hypothetical protein
MSPQNLAFPCRNTFPMLRKSIGYSMGAGTRLLFSTVTARIAARASGSLMSLSPPAMPTFAVISSAYWSGELWVA